jgi:hypothetical protein
MESMDNLAEIDVYGDLFDDVGQEGETMLRMRLEELKDIAETQGLELGKLRDTVRNLAQEVSCHNGMPGAQALLCYAPLGNTTVTTCPADVLSPLP